MSDWTSGGVAKRMAEASRLVVRAFLFSLVLLFSISLVSSQAIAAGDSQVSCPPPVAAELLKELVSQQYEASNVSWGRPCCDEAAAIKDPTKSHISGITRESSYSVKATVSSRLAGNKKHNVYVHWIVQPNGKGGSKISFLLRTDAWTDSGRDTRYYLPSRVFQSVRKRVEPWSEALTESLGTKCSAADWKGKQASMASGGVTRAPSQGSVENTCAMMGGTLRSNFYTRFVVPTGHDNGTLNTWTNVGVQYCSMRGRHGPLNIMDNRGRPLLSAFYVNNKLEGEVVMRPDDGRTIWKILSFADGKWHGETLLFSREDGSPRTFLVYDQNRLVGCSGRCKRESQYSKVPYIGPSDYSRYRNQAFLAQMEGERRMEEAEISRQAERVERLRLERERETAARLARSRSLDLGAVTQAAHGVVSRDCIEPRLSVRLLDDGWFGVSGSAACKEYIEVLEKTIYVKKDVTFRFAQGSDGRWTTRWGVTYTDPY